MTTWRRRRWYPRRSQPAPERTKAWKWIWEHDRQRALDLCDEIVRKRPVPSRLVARLGVTTAEERWTRLPRK